MSTGRVSEGYPVGHHPDDLGKLVARVVNLSGSRYVNIPRPLLHRLCWNDGDLVKVAIEGERLVLTRVPLEEIGKRKIHDTAGEPAADTLANVTDTQ